MFELEKSIAHWRRQMLAAGIKAPVPLDELEAHLREEIERQMRMGLNELQAFETAVSQIGKGAELNKEFRKNRAWLGLLGEEKSTSTERILGALWLVFYLAGLLSLWRILRIHPVNFSTGPLMIAVYGLGLFGSILLIRGAPMGRTIICTIAAGFIVVELILSLMGKYWAAGTEIFTACYIVTVCLLAWPSATKPVAETE